MSHEYEFAVFIGRFQPFHNGHLEIVKTALEKAKRLIVVIGSSRAARTIKNPWTFEERAAMIRASVPADASRVECVPVRDYYYNDQLWLSELHQRVRAVTGGSDSVALVGQYSDSSSHYLTMFPQWEFVPAAVATRVHATEIRAQYFEGEPSYKNHLPVWVASSLETFSSPLLTGNPYAELVEEYNFTKKYKESWASAPYVPTFVTTDAVVIQSGHVLLVKRKFNPGKNMWALPGGFIKPTELIVDGAIRELYEETKLMVPKEVARAHIVGEPKVFDYPTRDARGRTITHAICIRFKDDFRLPDCRGADDADKAMWVPVGDLRRMEEEFFQDHLAIIEYWLHRA
jgi:bifunctional NMN adenylyltransferase/nudix hydrolase